MFLLIQGGLIIGQSDSDQIEFAGADLIAWPTELQAIAPENLYWDGTAIQAKPSRPSPSHNWNNEVNDWEDATGPNLPPDFQLLTSLLRGTAIWGKAFEASERTLRANSAFTLLYGSLSATHELQDFGWAIARLRDAMAGIGTIGDFTPDELAQINTWLTEAHFPLQLI